MTREELIAALEKAEAGSRELDARIWGVANFTNTDSSPEYTTSIDAALTLVPENWWICEMGQNANGWFCQIEENGPMAMADSRPTLALALCIAALKARA